MANINLYRSYELAVKTILKPHDSSLADVLTAAIKHGTRADGRSDIFSVLAWASGNLEDKLPLTGNVLFQLVEKYKK